MNIMNQGTPVLIISNHGDIVGGGELSLLDFLTALDRRRWMPHVVVPHDGEVARRCRGLGLPTHQIALPSLRLPGPAVVRSIARLVALARQTGARLLHANGSRAMFYTGLAGVISRRPVLWHVRVADPEGTWDRFLALMASCVVVNSEAVKARFSWMPGRKVHRVYNGVDLGRFSPRRPPEALRRSLALPDNAPVVLSVGRFVAYKGYDDLLEAASLVYQTHPQIQWLVVGDGELREALLQRKAELGLNGTVHFAGWREDVPDLLALADLLVLPSHGEHFGRVLIEALAMAKPIVATRAGGVPEIVSEGQTGLLVPVGKPSALAHAVTTLIQNPALAHGFGEAGRSRAESLFSIQSHVGAMEVVYGRALGGHDARV